MNTKYIQELKVLSSQIDSEAKMGIVQNFSIVQDNMCEYYKNVDCDGLSMVPTHNCFFVVTKTRLKILDYARWLDNIFVSTNLVKLTPARMNLLTEISKNSNVISYALQEMCAIDNDSRKMRLLNTTKYPANTDIDTCKFDIDFDKIESNFIEEKYLVDEIKVKVSQIDFYRHINNVEYIKLMLNTLTLDEVNNAKFNDIQINYLHECREGDILKIYRKIINNEYIFTVVRDGEIVALAKFK